MDYLTENMEKGKLNKSFDIIGDIAIVKFDGKLKKNDKINAAETILTKNRNVKRIFEKIGMINGEERLPKLRQLIGKGSVTLYKENGFSFYVDVKKVFFSPRMSNERLRVINQVRNEENVLDMFCGVGPFTIPAAKKCKGVTAIDINEKAIELLEKNIKLNRIQNINFYCGDSRKIVNKLDERFDRIIMNFPLYAYKFLDVSAKKCKSGSIIHLYAFIKDNESIEIKKHIKEVLTKHFKTIKITEHRTGEVAPFLERKCFDIMVKN